MENHVYVVQSIATNTEKTNWGGQMDTHTHATLPLFQRSHARASTSCYQILVPGIILEKQNPLFLSWFLTV
jgi:hypothetical protein